jgi:hypothetical protein
MPFPGQKAHVTRKQTQGGLDTIRHSTWSKLQPGKTGYWVLSLILAQVGVGQGDLCVNYRAATVFLLLATIVLGGFLIYDRVLGPVRTVTVQNGSVNQGCSYVLYQSSGSFLADSCVPGGTGYKESTATALMSDMQAALGSSGGLVEVQKGTWTLASQWPTIDLSSLVVLSGEGPATLFQPGGTASFDPINASMVRVFNFNMVDKYGVQVSFTCDLECSDRQQLSFPMDTVAATTIGNTIITFLGNYIRLDSQTLSYPAFETGYAVAFRNGTLAGGTNSVEHSFSVRATVRTAQLKRFFPLFMEPVKGDYSDFIGFRWTNTTNLSLETHLRGIATLLNVARNMDTNDHTYELDYQCCALSATQVVYKYDGVTIGTINTNIIPYPGPSLQTTPYGPELEACEPDGQIMAIYLKTPFLSPVTI